MKLKSASRTRDNLIPKRWSPDATMEYLIALGKRRRLTGLAVETNQFQYFLATELTKRSNAASVYLPVRKITHTTDKLGRIQSLQPLVANGTLRFSKRHRKLIDELIQFPFAAHDDGPDALALAVEAMRAPRVYVTDPDAIHFRGGQLSDAKMEKERIRMFLCDEEPTYGITQSIVWR